MSRTLTTAPQSGLTTRGPAPGWVEEGENKDGGGGLRQWIPTPIFGKRLCEEINGRSNVKSEYWHLQSLVASLIWPHCQQTIRRDRTRIFYHRRDVQLSYFPNLEPRALKEQSYQVHPYRPKVYKFCLSDVMHEVYRCVVVWEPVNKVSPSKNCSPHTALCKPPRIRKASMQNVS